MIRIEPPYPPSSAGCARLCAQVELEGRERAMWFSTAEPYGDYLTDDRADAFLTALLPAALRRGAEIRCEGPVTRRLFYRLSRYLLPVLGKISAASPRRLFTPSPRTSRCPAPGRWPRAETAGWTATCRIFYRRASVT